MIMTVGAGADLMAMLIGFVILPPNTPAEFAAAIRRDLDNVGKIVKAAKIQPE